MGSIDINSTSENSDFDVNFYRTFYNDLNGLSDSELIQHYNKFGKKEHRFTSKKKLDDLIATTGINDFDFEFYRSYYEDLNKLNTKVRIIYTRYQQIN
jgi:vacuolar-type H+-ATPase subunit C/Vma6